MPAAAKKFKCHHCSKTYASKQGLRGHLSRLNVNITDETACRKAIDDAINKESDELDREPVVLEEAAEDWDLEAAAKEVEDNFVGNVNGPPTEEEYEETLYNGNFSSPPVHRRV